MCPRITALNWCHLAVAIQVVGWSIGAARPAASAEGPRPPAQVVVSDHQPPTAADAAAEAPSSGNAPASGQSDPQPTPTTFQSVTPGETDVTSLTEIWGPPGHTAENGNHRTLTFDMPPFQQVSVTARDGIVREIILQLAAPQPAAKLARRLGLDAIVAVEVDDDAGQAVGRVFPERGVMFAYHSTAADPEVGQVVLQELSGEAFFLRAEASFGAAYGDNLRDLQQAVELDSELADAHALQAVVLLAVGQVDEAASSVEAALQLEPNQVEYRLILTRVLAHLGRGSQAREILESLRLETELPRALRADVLLQLGDLFTEGPQTDFARAAELHGQMIELLGQAAPQAERTDGTSPSATLLLNGYLAMARDVGNGDWEDRAEAAPQWLARARAAVDRLVAEQQASPARYLDVIEQSLAAQLGYTGEEGAGQRVTEARQHAETLLRHADDALFQGRIHWQMVKIYSNAVHLEHLLGNPTAGLRFIELARHHFEQAQPQFAGSPRGQRELGAFYFRAGALLAVHQDDHQRAVRWYASAEPLLAAAAETELMDPGERGDMWISMGVSWWQVGEHARAIRLTEQGTGWIREAVDLGLLAGDALRVPYGNLESMHRHLNQSAEADRYARLASFNGPPADSR